MTNIVKTEENIQKLNLILFKDYNRYSIEESDGDAIFLLGYCIVDLWPEVMHQYIEWALDPEEFYMSLNIAVLHKEDDYIFINSQISDEPDYGPFHKISISQFVYLVQEWEKLIKVKTRHITIIQDEEKIIIVGTDEIDTPIH